jgi:hypothetical protein
MKAGPLTGTGTNQGEHLMSSAVPSSSTRHRGRRAGLSALLAGALVAGGIVFATTASAPASATSTLTDVITLQTGSSNVVNLYGATPGTVADTDALTNSGCRLNSDNSSVVGFTGTGGSGTVGLRQGSIGVINGGGGESCGQVNAPGELLSLDLKGNLAIKAVLDIELQKNTVVLATLTKGSAKTYVELQSGSSITGTRTLATAGGAPAGPVTVASCQTEQSSAANSGPTDNCRWVIDDAEFTSIELRTIVGNASLEGGADGTVTRLSRQGDTGPTDTEPLPAASAFTYFMLRDKLNCGPGDKITIPATSTSIGGTVERFGNASGSTCVGFLYDVRPRPTGLELIKTQTNPAQNDIQLLMSPEYPAASPNGSIPAMNFSFHDKNGVLSNNTFVLTWCAAPFVGADGVIAGITPAQYSALTVDMEPPRVVDGVTVDNFPGKQWACLGEPNITWNTTGADKVIQPVYVLGDAFPRR